jgi:tripartite-type tricarboxylate transporter receptor subunit TctC
MNPNSASIDRRRVLLSAAGGALMLTGRAAWSQAYPARPIHIVVPFTPGGSTDLLARAIGVELGRTLKQAIVIENLPGAGGSIGAERVAKAAPDGYTLLMGRIGTLAINPSLYPRLDYDPLRSFVPVAWVARVPNVLVVHASVPARDLKELIALAKAKPGFGWQRQRGAHHDGVPQAADGHLVPAHSLPRHGAGGQRPARGPGAGALHRHARAVAAHQGRKDPRPGGVESEAHRATR